MMRAVILHPRAVKRLRGMTSSRRTRRGDAAPNTRLAHWTHAILKKTHIYIAVILIPLVIPIAACTTPTTPVPKPVPIPPPPTKIEHIRNTRINRLTEDVAAAGFVRGAPIHIEIFKEERILELWMKTPNRDTYALYKTYPICKYSGALGPKLREGDRQAPEGFYTITPTRMNSRSKYHLSMNIGFPNAWDRAQGRTGSYLMIHGACESAGCYAMGNAAIEDIYLLTESSFKNGATYAAVDIYPFRMTADNLYRHRHSPWIGFWQMLARGAYE